MQNLYSVREPQTEAGEHMLRTLVANQVRLRVSGLIAVAFVAGSTGIFAQTLETVPIDPEGWLREKNFVEVVRKDFLFHIEGAKNISIPANPKAFAWKIDWKKQHAYCVDVADALFKNMRRLSFPEPSFSATRDPSSKLVEVLRKLPAPEGLKWRLSGNSPESAAVEFEKAIAAESARQGKPTRMRKGACDSPYWQRSYVGVVGSEIYQFTEMVNPDQTGCIGNVELSRKIEVDGSYRQLLDGDWFSSGIWGAYPNDTSADDRAEAVKAILGSIDGFPVIFEFGIYTFPLVKLGEMAPAKSDWGKPLYGKNGQRYVLVAHPKKNFENTSSHGGFAIDGPLPEKQSTRGLNGWPDPKYGNDSSRYACFINFDGAQRN